MFELPLFPLNIVLFPGMPIYLHIFEEQYKLMINQCVELRQPFGVVLTANDNATSASDIKPFTVGCTAHITQVQPLDQGRLNIAAIGKERFRIISLDYDQRYLIGRVETYPMLAYSQFSAGTTVKQLRKKVEKYLAILNKIGQVDVDIEVSQLPDDDASLIYLACSLLQISSQQKQQLLEIVDIGEVLSNLHAIYHYELHLMRILLSPPIDSGFYGTFSLS